jgi:hypothetical protein
MELFDGKELSDQELDHLLPEWEAPPAPARLRSSVFQGGVFQGVPASWWAHFWSRSIRVPLPAVIVIALAVVVAVWRLPAWGSLRTVPAIQSPADQVPANRRRLPAQDREQLLPVMELKPVITGRME